MLINIEVDVFDDPEYCTYSYSDTKCKYLAFGPNCMLFEAQLVVVGHQNRRYAMKCDQCKEAYQKEIDK